MKFVMALFAVLIMALPLLAQQQEEAKKPVGRVLQYISAEDQYHFSFENIEALRGILEGAGLEVVTCEDPWVLATPSLSSYDAIMMQAIALKPWPEKVQKAFVDYVNGGGGLIIVHGGNNSWPGWSEFEEMCGLCWRTMEGHTPKATHDSYGPFTVEIVDHNHFVTEGLDNFPITDECYYNLTKYSEFHVLARAFSKELGDYTPMIIVREQGKGRVFHTVLGHDKATMSAEGYITTTSRGALWAAKKDK